MLGVPVNIIEKATREFKGLPHRLELVGEKMEQNFITIQLQQILLRQLRLYARLILQQF